MSRTAVVIYATLRDFAAHKSPATEAAAVLPLIIQIIIITTRTHFHSADGFRSSSPRRRWFFSRLDANARELPTVVLSCTSATTADDKFCLRQHTSGSGHAAKSAGKRTKHDTAPRSFRRSDLRHRLPTAGRKRTGHYPVVRVVFAV